MILLLRHWHDPIADEIGRAFPGLARELRIESWLSQFAIRHTVGRHGAAVEFTSRAGSALFSANTKLVLNRVKEMPLPQIKGMSAEDSMYAASEACALFWSCLESLSCPVLNSPMALGTVGRASHPIGWLAHAAACGVPTADFSLATSRARRRAEGAWEPLVPPLGRSAEGGLWQQRQGTGARADCWVVGSRIVGCAPGMEDKTLLDFAARLGLGFGLLSFMKYHDGTWRLDGVDTMPLSAPPEVFSALLARISPKTQIQSAAAGAAP